MTARVARTGHQLLRMAVLLASVVLPSPVQAQQPVPQAPAVGEDPAFDAKARAIAEQIRCPVCLGNSVQDSPAELAHDMRQLVREQLAAGKTEAEIKQFFVQRYGEWVLLNPKAEGFNLVVWVLPVVMLLGGAAGVWLAVRRWIRVGRESVTAGGDALSEDDEYLHRVREEVARADP